MATDTGRRRTCVGCRKVADPEDPGSEMERIAAAADGTLTVGRYEPGRGAWVCSAACFDDATKRGALARALRRPVPEHVAQGLRATLFGRLTGPEGPGEGDARVPGEVPDRGTREGAS